MEEEESEKNIGNICALSTPISIPNFLSQHPIPVANRIERCSMYCGIHPIESEEEAVKEEGQRGKPTAGLHRCDRAREDKMGQWSEGRRWL